MSRTRLTLAACLLVVMAVACRNPGSVTGPDTAPTGRGHVSGLEGRGVSSGDGVGAVGKGQALVLPAGLSLSSASSGGGTSSSDGPGMGGSGGKTSAATDTVEVTTQSTGSMGSGH